MLVNRLFVVFHFRQLQNQMKYFDGRRSRASSAGQSLFLHQLPLEQERSSRHWKSTPLTLTVFEAVVNLFRILLAVDRNQ